MYVGSQDNTRLMPKQTHSVDSNLNVEDFNSSSESASITKSGSDASSEMNSK